MSADEYRRTVAELLEQIAEQRRRKLLLGAAGAAAPALEQEAKRSRQQLADLLH